MNPSDADAQVKFREAVVTRIKYRAMQRILPEMWRDPDAIEFIAQVWADEMVIMAEWAIPGNRYASRTVQVPDGWWQAFKQEVLWRARPTTWILHHLPYRLQRRFAARMRVIQTEVVKVAPLLDVPFQRAQAGYVRFLLPEPEDGPRK